MGDRNGTRKLRLNKRDEEEEKRLYEKLRKKKGKKIDKINKI